MHEKAILPKSLFCKNLYFKPPTKKNIDYQNSVFKRFLCAAFYLIKDTFNFRPKF